MECLTFQLLRSRAAGTNKTSRPAKQRYGTVGARLRESRDVYTTGTRPLSQACVGGAQLPGPAAHLLMVAEQVSDDGRPACCDASPIPTRNLPIIAVNLHPETAFDRHSSDKARRRLRSWMWLASFECNLPTDGSDCCRTNYAAQTCFAFCIGNLRAAARNPRWTGGREAHIATAPCHMSHFMLSGPRIDVPGVACSGHFLRRALISSQPPHACVARANNYHRLWRGLL